MKDALVTELRRVDPLHPDAALLAHAASLLRHGGLVVFPTETVYGLGANALDAVALQRIYEAKGRPATDPIIAHIAHIAQLELLARDVPDTARRLAEAFWPGPLTLVLHRAPGVPEVLAKGLDTVAVRMPAHPVARELLQAVDLPVGAPSANTFTRPSGTTATDVLEDLNGRVDLIIDAGPATQGLESTIVDLTDEIPTVLRPGGVSLSALRSVLPEMVQRSRFIDEQVPSSAPGQMMRHYSPRAAVRLYSDAPRPLLLAAMREDALALARGGKRPGFLLWQEDRSGFEPLGPIVDLGARTDLSAAGRALFAGMRRLDREGVDAVLVADPGRDGLGAALWDRLLRAAEGRVIRVGAGAVPATASGGDED